MLDAPLVDGIKVESALPYCKADACHFEVGFPSGTGRTAYLGSPSLQHGHPAGEAGRQQASVWSRPKLHDLNCSGARAVAPVTTTASCEVAANSMVEVRAYGAHQTYMTAFSRVIVRCMRQQWLA